MQDQLKVPKDRLAVIIGEKGKIKRSIESATDTTISINSKDAEVTIDSNDGLQLLVAKNIIQAIARGFNPSIANRLLKDDQFCAFIDMTDFCRNKQDLKRVKARAIGTDGKARKMLERLTNTHIVVYGKTVGIIGAVQNTDLARRAMTQLLQGAKHGNVYALIEREKRRSKE